MVRVLVREDNHLSCRVATPCTGIIIVIDVKTNDNNDAYAATNSASAQISSNYSTNNPDTHQT